ncbi:MAG: hypothetical protein OXD46_07345 [Chloroflexi bacterium]|nr:hypothetical protein [Chloroflexota bacterium]
MAGGSALLTLAGPVGWGVGGAVLVGSGLYPNSRIKSHAKKATEELVKVEAETSSLLAAGHKIDGLRSRTVKHSSGCRTELAWQEFSAPADYSEFDVEQKERLAAPINHIRSLSELLRTEVVL